MAQDWASGLPEEGTGGLRLEPQPLIGSQSDGQGGVSTLSASFSGAPRASDSAFS